MKSKVLIGTSGWGYEEWIGPFYPKGLTSKDFLLYYSKIFYTNEINTTFYNIPSEGIVRSWVKRTPSNFFFTVKIPKIITHDNKLDLKNCSEDLEYFLKVMQPMTETKKLLAFLVQLPPTFRKKEHFDNLKNFIDDWPEDWKEKGYYLVIEFRDKSWMDNEIFDYLRKKDLSYCAVIEPLLPPRMDITNPEFAYIRFHGFGKKIWFDYLFKEEEIKNWAIPIRDVIQNSKKVGIYFNNHFSGYAAKNSLMMMRELNVQPRNDPDSIKILNIKKESGTLPKGQSSLDKYF